MKILVTGATGFIGRNIVNVLCRQGHEVHGLVRRSGRSGRSGFLLKQGVRLIYGDVADLDSLCRAAGKFDALFHCSGYVNDRNWDKLFRVNILGTENVCKLALRLEVERMVYLSSVAVVSGNPQVPLTEDLPYSATNLYGRSKIEAEKIVLDYRLKGLRSAVIRPPMIYGEDEPHLFKLLLLLLKYRLFPVIDGGNNKLHLAYVGNIAQAAVMALKGERFVQGAYFAADKEVLSVRQVYSILAKAVSAPEPLFLPRALTRPLKSIPVLGKKVGFFLKDRVYDLSRISELGYKPEFKAEEALLRSARYFFPPKGSSCRSS